MYSPSPKAKRVEFRCPDPSCNPYLAFSAMLMAVLDGIQNKIHPGEPLDKDIYDLAPEELAEVPKTPGSLDESLRRSAQATTSSCSAATCSRADVIDTWIWYKQKNEVDAMRAAAASVRVLLVLRHVNRSRQRPQIGGPNRVGAMPRKIKLLVAVHLALGMAPALAFLVPPECLRIWFVAIAGVSFGQWMLLAFWTGLGTSSSATRLIGSILGVLSLAVFPAVGIGLSADLTANEPLGFVFALYLAVCAATVMMFSGIFLLIRRGFAELRHVAAPAAIADALSVLDHATTLGDVGGSRGAGIAALEQLGQCRDVARAGNVACDSCGSRDQCAQRPLGRAFQRQGPPTSIRGPAHDNCPRIHHVVFRTLGPGNISAAAAAVWNSSPCRCVIVGCRGLVAVGRSRVRLSTRSQSQSARARAVLDR